MSLAKMIRVIISWFDDHIYLRLLKNASWLTGGTFIAGLLSLGSIALTARSIGPSDFGTLVIVMTYAAIVDRLLNFQSWQFLIKNGADALEQNDKIRFRRQVKFSSLLDSVSSALSTIVAISFAGIAGYLIDWTDYEINLAMAYSLTIFFHLSGMPTGVLRLFNQFKTIAKQKILLAIFTLVGVLTAWIFNGDLSHFLLAYALSNIAGNLYLLAMGWRQLRLQKITGIWSTPLTDLQHSEPGMWRFVIYTNIESSVKIVRDLDIFLIKAILTAEAVGLYIMARKIAEALHMLVDSFFHAIYPEFSKLIALRDTPKLRRLVIQTSLSVGIAATLVWIGFIVTGDWLVPFVFGPSFAPVYTLASICMLGSVFWAFSQPLSPILYNLGRARDLFIIHAATAVIYIVALAALTIELDVVGSSIAYAGFFFAWSTLIAIVTRYRFNTHTWESQ